MTAIAHLTPVECQKIFKVALHFLAISTGVQPDQIMSKSRVVEVVDARCLLCWCLRSHGISLPTIARLLNRDRSAAHYLVDRCERLTAAYPRFSSLRDGIAKSIADDLKAVPF